MVDKNTFNFSMGTDVLFIALMLLVSTQKVCVAWEDTITSTHILKDGNTIVSNGGIFELGFFSPNNSSNRYVGIWYKQDPIQKVLWVANRDTPITNTSSAVLRIINPGGLALVDANNTLLWYANPSRLVQNPVARLLDSGNLVITDANENFLWQSFEHPTDTLFPGIIMGKNFLTGLEISLSAWKTENNPASGEYKYFLEPKGYPQQILTYRGQEVYRLGPWNGLRWSGSPFQQIDGDISKTYVTINPTGVFWSYKVLDSSTLGRVMLVLSSSGTLQSYSWGRTDVAKGWTKLQTAPEDVCDTYGYCGAYGNCDMHDPICRCLDKFLPKNPIEYWNRSLFSGGCVRKTPLGCQNGSLDGFLKYSGIKLPDTKLSWFNKTINIQDCEQICLNNCTCTAYSSLDISNGENGCLLWFGDLIDIRVVSQKGQDLFIRIAASDLDYTSSTKGKKSKIMKMSSSLSVVLLVLSFTMILIFYKRKRKGPKLNKLELEQDQTLFETSTIIKATDNFSLKNKLGEGGYGPVYRGFLRDGKEIAVKRLSKTSKQGLEEFKNEVNFISKLQHRNLVKLMGWCIQGEEKMLIYEYMPNKSLDSFIFDHTRTLLDWPRRFDIINGIARGLLYLHQDSRLKIIHRDLKASNVLLDIDMIPKISDFGLARSVGRNEVGANTNRVAGTQGYMSPEYARHGVLSTKLDVFSFGVLLLEIVSGKRNREFSHRDHYENLPSYAWKLYRDDRSIELVDEHLVESCGMSQVLRSIHVGLLCVQQHPEDRPNIFSVVHMLSNEVDLPIAKEPGFFTGRINETQISRGIETLDSRNEVTISSFNPR